MHVHDLTGALVRRLVDGTQSAGYQRAYWNGYDDQGRILAPGVYYCRFRAGDYRATEKLVLQK